MVHMTHACAEWFPEVHRAYALRGAELLVFPSAIGAEKDAPEIDTSEAWQIQMRGQAIANGTFVAAVNRVTPRDGEHGRHVVEPGPLGGQAFYGRSFVCGPNGAVLGDAGSEGPAVVLVVIELADVRRWRSLFPLLRCRRPSEYAPLVLDAQQTMRAKL